MGYTYALMRQFNWTNSLLQQPLISDTLQINISITKKSRAQVRINILSCLLIQLRYKSITFIDLNKTWNWYTCPKFVFHLLWFVIGFINSVMRFNVRIMEIKHFVTSINNFNKLMCSWSRYPVVVNLEDILNTLLYSLL